MGKCWQMSSVGIGFTSRPSSVSICSMAFDFFWPTDGGSFMRCERRNTPDVLNSGNLMPVGGVSIDGCSAKFKNKFEITLEIIAAGKYFSMKSISRPSSSLDSLKVKSQEKMREQRLEFWY